MSWPLFLPAAEKKMARQIMGGEIATVFPEYKDSVSGYPQYGVVIEDVFTITELHKIALSNIQVEYGYPRVPVDVSGKYVMCQASWRNWGPGGRICPKCNAHLFRRLKR